MFGWSTPETFQAHVVTEHKHAVCAGRWSKRPRRHRGSDSGRPGSGFGVGPTRHRGRGRLTHVISAAGLATGIKISKTQELNTNGEWSKNMGGLMPMALVRDRSRDREGEDDNRAKKVGRNGCFLWGLSTGEEASCEGEFLRG